MSVTTNKADEHPLLSEDLWRALREWYRTKGRHELPWRTSPTAWKILVAETLLHRTRADAVQAIYPGIIEHFVSPEAVLSQSSEWMEMTSSIGLAWRSRAFLSLCWDIQSRFQGEVPSDKAMLLALPGVGHYTASAVRCIGFGLPEILIDTNTMRLASRISGLAVPGEKHRTVGVRTLVGRLAPPESYSSAADNYALLDVAALVCLPSHPRCSECPLLSGCVTGRTQTTLSEGVRSRGRNG